MQNRNRLSLFRIAFVLFALTCALALIPLGVTAAPPQQGPAAAYYVQPGDTLYSIATRYGTNVPALMSANGLTSSYIAAGQYLVIPTGYSAPPNYNYQPYWYSPYNYWYQPYSSIYAPRPLPTAQLIPNPTFACTYTIQAKDTVFSVAYRYSVTVPSLMQANALYTPLIHIGQKLAVPCANPTPAPFQTYVVQPGENLLRIAIKFNTTIYAISLVNGIWNPNFVYAYQNLVIPYPGSYIWPPVPTPGPLPQLTPGATVTPTVTPVPGGPTPQPSGVVVMAGKAFIPGTLTISKGSTVLWQNNEDFTHTVASGVPGAADNKFRSGTLSNGQSFSWTFVFTGTYPYFSEIDANMTGTIVVQ